MLFAENRALTALTALCCALIFLLAAGGDEALAGKWKRKSKEHEEACKQWCRENRGVCKHCSTKRGCGKGYDTIRSWTGYGQNWHACKKRQSRDDLLRIKTDECNRWCRRNPDCWDCMIKTTAIDTCPRGQRIIKRWGGRGTNVYACGPRQYSGAASNRNRDDCFRWCRRHKAICRDCIAGKDCGIGWVAIKSWKGKGRNFHACASRDQVKAKNKEECEEYCAEHPGRCVECKKTKNCGAGLTNMKTFGIGNSTTDYHACRRLGALE